MENGGIFRTDLRQVSHGDMGISVPVWYNAFTPNGDGVNDELCFDVYNADTWEFEAYDTWGYIVFQSAGTVIDDFACVWDGTGACSYCSYACIIKFRNSCGEVEDNAYMVTVIGGGKKSAISDSSNIEYKFRQEEIIPLSLDQKSISEENLNIELEIYPNPSKGNFLLRLKNNTKPYAVTVYNVFGQAVYHEQELSSTEHEINIEDKQKGIYFVKVQVNDDTINRKIIIQ